MNVIDKLYASPIQCWYGARFRNFVSYDFELRTLQRGQEAMVTNYASESHVCTHHLVPYTRSVCSVRQNHTLNLCEHFIRNDSRRLSKRGRKQRTRAHREKDCHQSLGSVLGGHQTLSPRRGRDLLHRLIPSSEIFAPICVATDDTFCYGHF